MRKWTNERTDDFRAVYRGFVASSGSFLITGARCARSK